MTASRVVIPSEVEESPYLAQAPTKPKGSVTAKLEESHV